MVKCHLLKPCYPLERSSVSWMHFSSLDFNIFSISFPAVSNIQSGLYYDGCRGSPLLLWNTSSIKQRLYMLKNSCGQASIRVRSRCLPATEAIRYSQSSFSLNSGIFPKTYASESRAPLGWVGEKVSRIFSIRFDSSGGIRLHFQA